MSDSETGTTGTPVDKSHASEAKPESEEHKAEKPKKKKSKKRSWKQKLKYRMAPHKHCVVCGRAVPLDKEVCSQECQDKYQSYEKKKGRKNYVQLGFLVVMMVVMMVIFGGGFM